MCPSWDIWNSFLFGSTVKEDKNHICIRWLLYMCTRRAGKRIRLRGSQPAIMENLFTRRNLLLSLFMRWILFIDSVIRRMLLMNLFMRRTCLKNSFTRRNFSRAWQAHTCILDASKLFCALLHVMTPTKNPKNIFKVGLTRWNSGCP